VYRIRLPSGREAEFTSIEELALALQRGDVSRDAQIFHRRSNQWVPIGQHPRFQGRDEPGEPAGDEERPPKPTPVEDRAPPPEPAGPGTRVVETPPIAPAPIARAPIAPPADAQRGEPPRAEPLAPVAPTPFPVRPSSPPPPSPDPPRAPPATPRPAPADATRVAAREPDERRKGAGWLGRIFRLMLVLAAGAGAFYGWQRWGEDLVNRPVSRPGFAPAPAPSTLIETPSEAPAAGAPAPRPAPAPRSDPRAPVGVDDLIARHAAAMAASREQLAAEMTTIGFPSVFSAVSFASPLGARSARRRIASALNVIGQFHRRSVLLDQAYGDTASFQVTRAGWSAADRERWNGRPSLREPYASADLAESLLADADSLLAILGHAPDFEIRGDTVSFGDPARAAAYEAQRARLLERIGPPIDDLDRRPTLSLVRRSLDPARPPLPVPPP
jgi:hypothetical protein